MELAAKVFLPALAIVVALTVIKFAIGWQIALVLAALVTGVTIFIEQLYESIEKYRNET